MKYSIIGFPRIGIHRELKFETEKYFRNEITQIQYLEFVREQRALQWNKQLEHHVSLYHPMIILYMMVCLIRP